MQIILPASFYPAVGTDSQIVLSVGLLPLGDVLSEANSQLHQVHALHLGQVDFVTCFFSVLYIESPGSHLGDEVSAILPPDIPVGIVQVEFVAGFVGLFTSVRGDGRFDGVVDAVNRWGRGASVTASGAVGLDGWRGRTSGH